MASLTFSNKQTSPQSYALNSKKPLYKPANLGFPTKSSKLTVPVSGMSQNYPTASQGWKDAFAGKSVNEILPKQGPAQSQSQVPSKSTVTQPTATQQSTVTPSTSMNTAQSTPNSTYVPQQPQVTSPKPTPSASVAPQQTQYGSIVSNLVGASNPNKNQAGLIQQLREEALRNRQIGERARQISDEYGGQIAEVGRLGAGGVAGNLSTGSNIVGSGNAAIASQSASQRMSALSQAQQAALAGTAQELTGQNQLTGTLNQALGGANTQQAQQLSGLGAAGTLAAPSTAQYGQTVFDPTTGQYTGGNLDPQTQATNLAQQVMSGAMTYDQALASLGYAGQAGTNFLNNAITGAGGNPLQLQASGAAQQANITTSGTAGTDIARAGLGAVTPQYVMTEANTNAAKEQSDRALQILQQTGLNNVNSTDWNRAANELRSRMGDPNFAAFQTAINEAKNFYTSVLAGSGSTPTGNEEIAGNIAALNVNSPISAIVASLDELRFASATRLRSLSSAQQQFQSNLGGGGQMGGGGGTLTWDNI